MWGKARNLKTWPLAAAMLVSACDTIPGEPEHVIGMWGGPHAGLEIEGGLAEVQFDCASGTIDDPVYPSANGSFSVKGTYRTGAPGPIKVGEFFKSQAAIYSGEVARGASKSRLMTLSVTLEDGTSLGPFTLTEGMPPRLVRCS